MKANSNYKLVSECNVKGMETIGLGLIICGGERGCNE